VAIAALAMWAVTAAAGAYLLTHVIAAKRAEDRQRRQAAGVPEAARVPAPPAAASPAALPPIPRVKVTAGPDDHPLREFSHPALALCGLGCWLAFVATHDWAFAWIACGVLAATAGVGLSWLAGNARAARRRDGTSAGGRGDREQGAPAHLIAVHGLAAATTIALVVVTVVTTAHT
jgi:hypothetical protein